MGDVIGIFSHIGDGRNGVNRAQGRCSLGVDTDAEAIAIFLTETCKNSKETRKVYHREVNRLVNWAARVPQKCVSSLDPPDYRAYGDYLAEECKLQESSQRVSFAVVSSLLAFLVRHGYLASIPMFKDNVVRKPSLAVRRKRVRERQLTPKQHKILLDWFKTHHDFNAMRVRFALACAFYLGLRIHEVAGHWMKDFVKVDGQWEFHVFGKGRKYEELPVPDGMMEELARYRAYLSLSELPDRYDPNPLVPNISGGHITERQLSRVVRQCLLTVASELPDGPDKEALQTCTMHWFRHMFGSAVARTGLPNEDVSKMMRHDAFSTTQLYLDPSRTRRQKAIKDLRPDTEEAL